jgi:RimJ/RimL family protein N-acetyltransferase
MDEYPKEISLKSGQNLTLRLLEEEDIDSLVQFFKALPEEDRMYLRSDVTIRENIVRRFGSLNFDKVYPVIALDRDRIVAIGSLWRAEYGWMRNLGEIRVVVAKDFQRKGLCTILTREIFFHALTTDLYKIQAEVMEDQVGALNAFERLGFKKETVLRKHVTDINGKRVNLVIMSLDIQEMWYLMEDFIKGQFYVT